VAQHNSDGKINENQKILGSFPSLYVDLTKCIPEKYVPTKMYLPMYLLLTYNERPLYHTFGASVRYVGFRPNKSGGIVCLFWL
jgi:hypothetical protein